MLMAKCKVVLDPAYRTRFQAGVSQVGRVPIDNEPGWYSQCRLPILEVYRKGPRVPPSRDEPHQSMSLTRPKGRPRSSNHNMVSEDADTLVLQPQEQHANYNKLLNKRVEETGARGYQSAPVRYKHVVLIDEFYSGGGGSEKIRVTRDKNTGQIIECLAKRRLADLEITSPKRKVDWRVSVNIEQPVGVSPPLC